MRLHEPARAAAVIQGLESFGIRWKWLVTPVGDQRPLRHAETAAQVTPSFSGSEVERELRRRRQELFLRTSDADTSLGRSLTRAIRRQLAAETERQRLPLQRIKGDSDVKAETASRQFGQRHVAAVGERLLVREVRYRRMQIEGDQRNLRRRLL